MVKPRSCKFPVGDAVIIKYATIKTWIIKFCLLRRSPREMFLSFKSQINQINNNNGERDVAQSDQQTLPP